MCAPRESVGLLAPLGFGGDPNSNPQARLRERPSLSLGREARSMGPALSLSTSGRGAPGWLPTPHGGRPAERGQGRVRQHGAATWAARHTPQPAEVNTTVPPSGPARRADQPRLPRVSPDLGPICVHSLPAPTTGQQDLDTVSPCNWLPLTFCPLVKPEPARQKARRQSSRRPRGPAMAGGGWQARRPG